MDKSAKEITFDKKGVCNFCHIAQAELKQLPTKMPKVEGKVLMGLSGGADSSYTLHKAVEMGIKPICFSLDNGWNDPKADKNVKKMVDKLGLEHHVYKIDLEKYRELQRAFLKSGVSNIEIPTDHILMAATYEMAVKHGCKWVLSGGNVETESIMPASWGYNARDLVHIKDIFKKMTGYRLKGLPTCSLLKWNYYKWIKGIKLLYLLDVIGYNRAKAIKTLEKKYGYQDYGAKHEENVFTSWFQNFYLFEKFGIDKRKAHLSSLINSGQMTRKEALFQLTASPVYPNLGIESRVLKYPKRDYTEFKTDERLFNFISSVVKFFR